MAQDNSFDIVSKVDMQEVRNAIDQALKEIHQRFDLKDSHSEINLEGSDTIQLASANEYKLEAVKEILGQKLVKRGVSLKNLTYGKLEPAAGQSVRQKISLQQGIPTEKGQRDRPHRQGFKKEGAGQHPRRYCENSRKRPRRPASHHGYPARQGSWRGTDVHELPHELRDSLVRWDASY
jgi:hypothetical protein